MSRQIDLSKKLSDEDREYLQNNNRLRDIAIADGTLDEGGWEQPLDAIVDSHPKDPNAEDQSAGALVDLDQKPLPGSVEAQRDLGIGVDDGSAEQPDDNYDDEDAWSYRDLQAEAKDRDDVAGNLPREELIAALRADDAKPSEQG